MDSNAWSEGPLKYQAGGHAWNPCRPDIVSLLTDADHRECRPIYYGSNHTFLVTMQSDRDGESLAVYKPARGEYPLHDFPQGTLYRREIAAWLLDRLLGWSIVPPTVETRGTYGVGSLQLFIEAVEELRIDIERLRKIALFDVIANNADRKVDHCLPDATGNLWGIDHGLTFHAQGKLRTVLWHFAGTQLQRDELADIERLQIDLDARKRLEARRLKELISNMEWRALCTRLDRLLETRRFPDPRYKPVPYRW
jgi:hypothetical protein